MIHIIINAILIAALFWIGIVASRSKPFRWVALGAAIFLSLVPARPDWFVALLPFSWAVFYANLYPLSAALVIPSITHLARSKAQRVRLWVLCGILLCVSFLPYRQFLPPAAAADIQTHIDANGICRQTSADTCGAACIVTLLRQHGIKATEEEAIRLALTRRNYGTGILGQYRALRILTEASGKPMRVCLKKMSLDELVASGHNAIITAGLGKRQPLDTEEARNLVRLYSWRPGLMHNVVFLGVDEEKPTFVRIGEPDFGLERWRLSELRILYQGYAIWLEEVR